ncbi:hypothetical protein RJ639_015853, partial [Escallonia herrerae]
MLPKQGFTCCLAMDGVKVLASGFEMDEKVEIGKLVTAMGGVVHTKASLDVNFVIVKNVLAAKYKWALNVLKKPVVTINWLHQCWKEHRIVPQEPYRIPSFSGLTICVTKVPAGDKYKVAKRWGHIYLVTKKWFDQSVARRACLNEESYPLQASTASTVSGGRTSLMAKRSQDKVVESSQHAPSSVATDANFQAVLCDQMTDADTEATLSQNMSSTFSDAPAFVKEESGGPATRIDCDINLDACVADDSQTEDNDLYLSECRIMLVGFDASEMRKLVDMVRRGGGSRYMSFNDKLTHIVVGTPSETEKKEVRALAALGVIYVVRSIWLEECDYGKKEIPVLRRHMALDLILPKDPTSSKKRAVVGMTDMKQGKLSTKTPNQSILAEDQFQGRGDSGSLLSSEKRRDLERDTLLRATVNYNSQTESCPLNGNFIQRDSNNETRVKKSSAFRGQLFRFSMSFPENRKAEIVQWVNQGGGEVVDNQTEENVNFTVECHGVVSSHADATGSINVSSHWIRSCLEDGQLLDVGSHILYSPLPCQVPLPGFEKFRICVSQYDEKDRLLLRNLCFILGAKFVEKLTKKVTHLLCKFSSGPKYQAASKWGIRSVTSEWICECVRQSKVVAPYPFSPKEVTSEDREAGLCTMSQYPTQAARMTSGDDASQLPSQSQDLGNIQNYVISSKSDVNEGVNYPNCCNKRARVSEDGSLKSLLSSGVNQNDHILTKSMWNDTGNTADVPDVAAAIEDLLEQTSKVQKEVWGTFWFIFSSLRFRFFYCFRTDNKDERCNPPGDVTKGLYDGFSETQTESQVVGYEEDLSGRQMIIDRYLLFYDLGYGLFDFRIWIGNNKKQGIHNLDNLALCKEIFGLMVLDQGINIEIV